jgi:hypothetical protein
MTTLYVAPVGEPVPRLGLGVGDPFGSEAAGNGDFERL